MRDITDSLPLDDYARVKATIEYISSEWRSQPSLDEIADSVGLSTSHLNLVFKRWAGLTPKAFLQAVTLDHARKLLHDSASVLDATYELGLSGPGRLHDLFVTHEAMSPGEFKRGGEGLILAYGFHPSPFGEAIVVVAPRGLAAVGWVDDKAAVGLAGDSGKHAGGRIGALADMQQRWPHALLQQDQEKTGAYAARVFHPDEWQVDRPLQVCLIGTDFEIRVWQTLLRIPMGQAATYSNIAKTLGKPGAARAVGAAVGRNPVSFVVPCHRVLGASGKLTGYHWGITRKQAILGWEFGQTRG